MLTIAAVLALTLGGSDLPGNDGFLFDATCR